MNSQYYSHQQPNSVLDYPYDEDEDVRSSTKSPSSLHSFSSSYDIPPRSIPQYCVPPASPSSSDIFFDQKFGNLPQFAMSPTSHHWSGNLQPKITPSFTSQLPFCGEDMSLVPTAGYVTTSENDMFNIGEIPRGWEGYSSQLLQRHQNDGLQAFDTMDYNNADFEDGNCEHHQRNNTMYQSLMTPHDSQPMAMTSNGNYFPSPSQYPSLESLKFNTNSAALGILDSDVSDDGDGNASREMTVMEGEDLGFDEPYAKLIYRALMSKPDHSMVLQDIYQWFRVNTNKGSSDNKGWMNSIRHNLSMNAAFRKTERRTLGDECKKSTEWVLEEFAVKDGVQSTTRYRKGTANKKFSRSDTPAPSRQRSGQKGGFSTRNTTRLRRTGDLYRHHRMETGGSLRVLPAHLRRTGVENRQREPLTPPQSDLLAPQSASPYYGFHAPTTKTELQHDMRFDVLGGLENVQGVHMDGSPVFAADAEMAYQTSFWGAVEF